MICEREREREQKSVPARRTWTARSQDPSPDGQVESNKKDFQGQERNLPWKRLGLEISQDARFQLFVPDMETFSQNRLESRRKHKKVVLAPPQTQAVASMAYIRSGLFENKSGLNADATRSWASKFDRLFKKDP